MFRRDLFNPPAHGLNEKFHNSMYFFNVSICHHPGTPNLYPLSGRVMAGGPAEVQLPLATGL